MGSKITGSVQVGMAPSDGCRSQHDPHRIYYGAATEFNWTLVQLLAGLLLPLKGGQPGKRERSQACRSESRRLLMFMIRNYKDFAPTEVAIGAPPGRIFPRCSLLTYQFRYARHSRLEKQPIDPAAAHARQPKGLGVFVPEGLNDRSLAVYCLEKVRKSVPSRQGRHDSASRVSICQTKPHQNR